MITIDGYTYDGEVAITSCAQKFEKLSSDKSGRTQAGDMFIDPIGTFYNYTLTIQRKPSTPLVVWDELWRTISNPKAFVNVTFPNDQGTMTFTAYITSGERSLLRVENGKNYWGSIKLEFISKSPQRRP